MGQDARIGRRHGMLLAALGALTGCADDYSALRDWSMQARLAVQPLPVAPVPQPDRAGAVGALQRATSG
ncbi:hypothetical protein, partial [Falsiroseomonas oryzae]|uniref:hypothetical protein n=1 Tax=Falsiroseomonas oryzae TaxID=2766473 RepID=UPI0022EA8B41